MKKIIRRSHLYSLFAAILVFTSCSENENSKEEINSSPRIVKGVELVSPTANDVYVIGDSISFMVRQRDDIEIDSIQLEVQGTVISTFGSSLSWKASYTGSPQIKIHAFYDEKKETLYPKVKIYAANTPSELTYRIVKEYPHDPEAYTQGLYFHEGKLIESTGQRGKSTIRIVDYENGDVLQSRNLASNYFGEGATVIDNNIYQLTWTSRVGFIYDLELNEIGNFRYNTEGWGLTKYEDQLLMTDGSNKLRFIDPTDFSIVKTLEVFDDKKEIANLNEIEVIDGRCYANVYAEDYIVTIDLETGAVLEKIEVRNLIDRTRYAGPEYALNGIAYLESENRIFITGKLWPSMFEVEFIEKPL